MERLELDGTFKLARRISPTQRAGTHRYAEPPRARRRHQRGAECYVRFPGRFRASQWTFDLLQPAGHLLLDATLAETTTGIKSLVARAAQPFFRRAGGGSKLPIRISGPRAKPEFGLDVKKLP